MQCPRCYFDNPSGTRVCEYCGAKIESTTGAGTGGGSASQKRKTMLGPVPTVGQTPPARPPKLRQVRIDPDDPFRVAAQGIGAEPSRPEPESASSPVAAPPSQPDPPPAESPARPELSIAPPARRSRRATVVTLSRPDEPSVAGAAIIIPPTGSARAILLREGRTRIGRREGAEIRLEDPKVSTDHALLRIEAGQSWLLDTSSNGTFVSGVPCINDRADVSDGAVLRVGETRIVVKLIGEDALAHLALED